MAENSFILFPLRDGVCVLSPWVAWACDCLSQEYGRSNISWLRDWVAKGHAASAFFAGRLAVGSLSHHVRWLAALRPCRGAERERDERCLMNPQSFESFLTIQVSPADTWLSWRRDKPPQGALSEFLMDDICELNTMAVVGGFATVFWGNLLYSNSCSKHYGPLLTGSQLFRAYCMPGTMD